MACGKGSNNYFFYNFSNYSKDDAGLYADNYEDNSNDDYFIFASPDFSSVTLTKVYDHGEGVEEIDIELNEEQICLCIGALLLAKERKDAFLKN